MSVRFMALVLVLSWGCTETERPTPVAVQRAVVSEAGDKEIFLIAKTPAGTDLRPALNHEKTDFWWVRVEIPLTLSADVDTEQGFSTDLQSRSDVVFAQSYNGPCDPHADVPSSCWLLEQYTGADEGLKGSLAVKRASGRLEFNYFVDWRGITDRFQAPPSWHNHVSEGGAAAAIEVDTQ